MAHHQQVLCMPALATTPMMIVARALTAAGFRHVVPQASTEPGLTDDDVVLADGYRVQCHPDGVYFAVNRQGGDDKDFVITHLHDADSAADAVAWCVANLPPSARGAAGSAR